MTDFCMPSLGADMAAGTLHEWLVKPGDAVKRGDVIAEVETDKGVIDVEVWEDGVVERMVVEPGTEVPVGALLAIIRTAGEAPAVVETAVAAAQPSAVEVDHHPMDHRPLVKPPAAPVAETNGKRLRISPVARKRAEELGVDLLAVAGSGPGGAISLSDVEAAAQARPTVEPERVRVSPVARRMSEDLGIDLTTVTGSGPHGTITKADIECAAAKLRAEPQMPAEAALAECVEARAPVAPAKTEAPTPAEQAQQFQVRMRQAIAAAMSRSNREIPHYYLETRIDVTKTLAWLEVENLKRSIKDRLLPVVLLIKATARALVDVPELNGFWIDDALQVQEAIHIGFAVALRQGGLVTPAIHNADMKSLDELMADVRDVITRTRAGRLRSSDLTDSTITLTSLGDMGVEKVYGVIYPPQVALVGFGKVMEQPWAENGMLGIRRILTATLAGDHRASDGLRGARFMDALTKYLQEVETL